MPDNFNFLGLPSVVQELITNEIVHNSIPEDRIQLALTSKYCNELVQRARPKKIIDQLSIQYSFVFHFYADQKDYCKSLEQLMEILPNCQIKRLVLENQSLFLSKDYSGISDMLFEAARFATKLDYRNSNHMDKFVEFYVKFKHLKSVTLGKLGLILPYYPSKVKLVGYGNPPANFFEDLAEKSLNCPLSFLELKCSLSLQKYQQFLQTANFSIGADFCIGNEHRHFSVYFTYLGQYTFTLEIFTKNSLPIYINQKIVGKNRRILKLKRTIFLGSDIAFNVVSASNPDKNYFSGVFKREQQMFILENIDRDEILKVKFADKRVKQFGRGGEYYARPRYSAKMLESAFPTANFTTPGERVEKINNVLGTNIQVIQAENFVSTVEIILHDLLI